jgi:hypothetical protein
VQTYSDRDLDEAGEDFLSRAIAELHRERRWLRMEHLVIGVLTAGPWLIAAAVTPIWVILEMADWTRPFWSQFLVGEFVAILICSPPAIFAGWLFTFPFRGIKSWGDAHEQRIAQIDRERERVFEALLRCRWRREVPTMKEVPIGRP